MIQRQFKLLIVDDNPKNIQVVAGILGKQGYDLSFSTSGKQALELIAENLYDLILLDIMMPDMDGYEVCKKLKMIDKYHEVPVIFLTARNDEESIVRAFDIGGQDFVTKPFRVAELLARVKTHLRLKAFEDSQQEIIDEAVEELKNLNQEIIDTQKEVVYTMGSIAETRSPETGLHVKRVAEYSKLLALLSGVSLEEAEIIKMASPMHDIGKVAIPDSILNKPGKHNEDEFEIMKTHAQIGYEMLKHSERPILKTAAIIAIEHHEKWDGTGYPHSKKAENIHLYGRITALADVFDALGSRRCYKEIWQDDQIFALLKEQSGKHFDPDLIKLFFDNLDKFMEIREKFKDEV